MIRHSPAENYFRYLIAHPKCFDNKYIHDIAEELQLDYLGDWYIQSLRNRANPPPNFRPDDETHGPSQRFLLREGLTSAFFPDRHYKDALRILARPRWRELTETMMLSGASDEVTVHALKVRMKANVTAKAIQRYRYYFWNIDLLGSMEMRALLELRHSGALASDDKHVQVQHTALRAMRHTDPRVVAARLPSSPLSGLVAQMEMGVLPRKIDVGEVVERTMEAALVRTYAAVTSGGPMGGQLSQSFAVVADIMQRLKQSVVNPEDALREDLRRISVATTPNKTPTIKELTGGNHTTNVLPDPVVVETSAEPVEDDEHAP